MKIGLCSDHRGYKLKESLKVFLQEKGYEIEDFGTNSFERCDHPVYAKNMCQKIVNDELTYGIAICGTGIGMSIACNKMKGIYCAKVSTVKEAIFSRSHNNCNVIAISGNMCKFKAKKVIMKFIKTKVIDDIVYEKRRNEIKEIEEND